MILLFLILLVRLIHARAIVADEIDDDLIVHLWRFAATYVRAKHIRAEMVNSNNSGWKVSGRHQYRFKKFTEIKMGICMAGHWSNCSQVRPGWSK